MNQRKDWTMWALPPPDYLSILPVPELALEIRKLEGEVSEGSATPLCIDIEVDSMDDARVDKVLRQLIEPLKCSLVRDYQPSTTWLYVKGADDTIDNSLEVVLVGLNIPNGKVGETSILRKCPDHFLINDWVDLNIPESDLVTTAELHDRDNSDSFESTNAFIPINMQLLEDKDTFLYLLYMMDSIPYYLNEIVSTYLFAQ